MSYNVHKHTKFWDTIVTRSIREMIDFLMSILSTPFCVHADKTSNFVDLLSNVNSIDRFVNIESRIPDGIVRISGSVVRAINNANPG